MADSRSVFFDDFSCLSRTNLLDHLTADGTGLTAGELAVIAVLQVDTDFSGGPANILKCPHFAIKRAAWRWFRGVLR